MWCVQLKIAWWACNIYIALVVHISSINQCAVVLEFYGWSNIGHSTDLFISMHAEIETQRIEGKHTDSTNVWLVLHRAYPQKTINWKKLLLLAETKPFEEQMQEVEILKPRSWGVKVNLCSYANNISCSLAYMEIAQQQKILTSWTSMAIQENENILAVCPIFWIIFHYLSIWNKWPKNLSISISTKDWKSTNI